LGLPLPSQFKTFFDQHALADNQSTLVCERQSVANILIADDDINYAHKLQAQLKDAFDVRVVHTSARVVSLCQEAEPPDLVLVSVSLGEGDGFELCRHLKSQEKTTRLPIFLLAEDYSEEAEVKGLQYGAADFLRKGGSPVILQARMKTHLQLRRMTEILEVRANYDSLTGLHNRREFEHVLENEWRRACRVQAPLTLLFIDVDHFKAYNDHYGHLAGDECLRRLGEVLGRCLSRSGEFVARYGGEEFVALLPGVEGRAVERSVENIQRMVEKLEIEHQASPDYRQLSLSIGAVTQVPQLNVSPQQLLAEADQRLYQAKSEGRNRLIYTERP
jgi:diguanylate cyclase (GGDEF)-like protein